MPKSVRTDSLYNAIRETWNGGGWKKDLKLYKEKVDAFRVLYNDGKNTELFVRSEGNAIEGVTKELVHETEKVLWCHTISFL